MSKGWYYNLVLCEMFYDVSYLSKFDLYLALFCRKTDENPGNYSHCAIKHVLW